MVTIKSMDGEWAIIETPTEPVDNNGNPATLDNCENTYVISFRMEWSGDDLRGDNASGCNLQRLEIKGGAYYCIKFETTWDWNDLIPMNKRYGASNITIEDCKIHDSGRDCIKLTENCNNIIIRRTEIYNSGMSYPAGTPIEDKNAEGLDNVQGNGLIVEDSYIHDIATNGIYCKGGARDCIIQRSIVEKCGDGGILLGFDTSPEYFDTATNPDYYENINGTVRNCIVKDTEYEGIGMYASKDAKVYNNTLINVAKNNAHSAIYFGVATQDYDPIAKRPANINPTVYNNIVKQAKGLNNLMIAIRYSSEGSTAVFDDRRPESEVEKMGLAEWKTHIGGESATFEKDPLLDARAHLVSGSPCINAGKNVATFTDDIDKQTRKDVFDIGADEFDEVAKVQFDFNGDGKTDLLWKHKINGKIAIWLINGTAIKSSAIIGAVEDLNWEIIKVGDFNGDGKADFLWKNKVNGKIAVWLMDGTAISSYAIIGAVEDLNWEIINIGDFNGDGKTDILWKHKINGKVAVWLMNGTAIQSDGIIGAVEDLNWNIINVGDFNGDGKTDLLWKHKTNGKIAVWLMNGTAISSYDITGAVEDLNWDIINVGDFNGDGKTDLLWKHKINGKVAVWLMNGTAIQSDGIIGAVEDLNWDIINVGDFNGDGKTDFLWKHKTSGKIAVWLMNGTAISSYDITGEVSDLNWDNIKVGDFNGDGKSDFLWKHKNSGKVAIWLMNGTAIQSYDITGEVSDLNWDITK